MNILRKKEKVQEDNNVLILYASKSGNAKNVAELTQKYFQKNGIKATCSNIITVLPGSLKDISKLLIVISTHGEGDPPPAAKIFFKALHSNEMPMINHLAYSVCALGDSSYKHFCQAGKKIDQRLQELGANCFYPRIDCDTDFSQQAIDWIKKTCEKVNSNEPKQAV